MPSGFIETASSPAIAIRRGDVGTMAANIMIRMPSQLIMLFTGAAPEVWSQCVIRPSENAVNTRYPSPAFRVTRGFCPSRPAHQ
jgi:hypothetical protein